MHLEEARRMAQRIANMTREPAVVRYNLNDREQEGRYQAWSGMYNRSNVWYTNNTLVEYVEPEEGSYIIAEED